MLNKVRDVAKGSIPEGGQLYLYGSRARGDNRSESDWDFLILLNKDKIEKSDYDEISFPITLLGWELGQDFVPVLYTFKNWDERRSSLFYHNVTSESIRII